MAKKYLSLEEAAQLLGISGDELKRAREKGDIRGFADRGNWKFRQNDVEEFGRSQQADSSPEVPLFGDDELDLDGGSSILSSGDSNVLGSGSSGSHVVAGRSAMLSPDDSILDDDDAISEQPTVIRQGGSGSDIFAEEELDFDEGASDSGVRLVLDSNLLADLGSNEVGSSPVRNIPISFGDSDQVLALDGPGKGSGSKPGKAESDESSVEIPLSFGDSSQEFGLAIDDDDSSEEMSLGLSDSDSNVRLVADPDDESLADSSSEVLLTSQHSDSDVRLLDQTIPMRLDPDSDSDVRLIKTDSDSDVQLVGTDSDSDVRLLSPAVRGRSRDSDVSLGGTDADIKLNDLSISDVDNLALSDDSSGIRLGSGSGIKLEADDDSGIALDIADSGISLDVAMDSGISLDMADDSGIALDIGTDSDISLAPEEDSGIALDMPADSGISLDSDGLEKTAPAMRIRGRGRDDASTADTLVQMPSFDDDASLDDESDFELGALEGESSSDTSVLLFDDEDDADDRAATMIKKGTKDDSEETFDLEAGEAFDEEFDEEYEDDLLGEDDEIEDFADDEEFMADDDAFDDGFVSEDGGGFVAPAGAGVQMVVEHEWGGLVFGVALVSSIAMILCAGVMFDLVRFMWQSGDPNAVAGPLLDMVK